MGVPGSSAYSSGTFTINASGADIEGTSDQFHYVYQPLSGDGTIIARITSIQNTDSWAKAGVMIRETLTPNSRHAMMLLTPGNGLAFQRRVTTGGGTFHTSGSLVVAPYWVKMVRSGNTFTAYSSANGSAWTLVGSDTITMTPNVYVGLALTSHNNTALCTATIESVNATPSITVTSPASGATFAAPAAIAIGATPFDSSAAVTRVDFYNGPILLGTSTTAPYGYTWNGVGAGSYSLSAQATDSLGTVFTSSSVAITVNPAGSGLPTPWADQDIGAVGVTGSSASSSGTFTVNASGTDIWDLSDQFHYVYQPLTGDGTIIARVTAVQNTNPWAKAGVMIRETLANNSTHAMMILTPANVLSFQNRLTTGAGSGSTSGGNASAPYWVKIVRSGSTFSGYKSANGTTWTLVGSVTISMGTNAYFGLALTSHNNTVVCQSTMDNVTVSPGAN